MQYAVCTISVIPMRIEPYHQKEMVSQVLYGECFKITKQKKDWSYIILQHDEYEGWISNHQFLEISKATYDNIKASHPQYLSNLMDYVQTKRGLMPVTIGAKVSSCDIIGDTFEGNVFIGKLSKRRLIAISLNFLNTPYLWGGRTPFGIDCSGFVQLVYMLCGYQLPRDAKQQIKKGTPIGSLEEGKPGDLAFFDNDDGKIVHVAILMENNNVIHAHGGVRIDKLNHIGIYNEETQDYSHKLKLIKTV